MLSDNGGMTGHDYGILRPACSGVIFAIPLLASGLHRPRLALPFLKWLLSPSLHLYLPNYISCVGGMSRINSFLMKESCYFPTVSFASIIL